MRTICIIQARMGSSRLPGKVMKPLAGREVLWHVRTRVDNCKQLDDVIVATSTETADDVIANYCDLHSWLCYRGSERDVLARFYHAARRHRGDAIVRVTCDCPLIDPDLIAKLVARFSPSGMDYMSVNYPKRTYPVGLDCEIMTAAALHRAYREATAPYDREHVTPYFYTHPSIFMLGGVSQDVDQSGIRLTLDTEEDYGRLARLYGALYREGEIISTDAAIRFVDAMDQ